MSSVKLAWAAVAALGVSALATLVRSMDDVGHVLDGRVDPVTLVVDVRDALGRPLAARMDVTPLDAPSEPAQWPLPMKRVRGHGQLRSELQPGRHRVRVSHGPRHELVTRDLTLGAGTRALSVVLAERVPSDGYECVDLHVHSTASPDHHGGISALDLEAEGLDLSVTTDHNRAGAMPSPRLPALSGVELTSWAPEVGHFNAFPVTRVPRHTGTTPSALFAALHTQGDVFVQVNHPRLEDHIAFFTLGGLRGTRFTRPGFTLHGADGLEVWNGYDIARPDAVLRVLGELGRFHARGLRLLPTGGSDSHGGQHLPGYPRTCVRRAQGEPLARALKRGDAFVTNGPSVLLRVAGHAPGELVSVEGELPVRVEVRAHPALSLGTVELWADGARLRAAPWRRPAPGEPFVLEASVDASSARSVHARVLGGSGLAPFVGRSDVQPLAFSAPVYLRGGPERVAARD